MNTTELANRRERRRKLTGENFTPPTLVNEMLNKLPSTVWQEGKTYLDPSCGNGNFLVEVLNRKIEIYHHNPLEALKTIYGVDLMQDNVSECQVRLLSEVMEYEPLTREHVVAVLTNIICHDALTYNFEFDKVPTEEEIARFL